MICRAPSSSTSRTCISIELATGRWLLETNLTHGDARSRVTLGPYRRAEDAAEHGELAHMRQRIGQRPLDEKLERASIARA
jgi:hypothetical protein